MFGSVGGMEFVLIAVIALLLFGPRKLPQIGRSIGRAMAEFRGATQEFKSSLQREVELEELRDVKKDLSGAAREISGRVDKRGTPVRRGDDPAADDPPADDPVAGQACPPDGETPPKP